MASLFDGIFQVSGKVPVNYLFSSNNKFKSAKAAEAVASMDPAAIGNGGDHSTADMPASAKASKKAVRKAAGPAEPQQASVKGHKRPKAVASSHTKRESDAQELHSNQNTPNPVKEPRLKKRKRLEVKSNGPVEPSPADVDESFRDMSEVTVDASAVHEAAAQVHIALLYAVLFCVSISRRAIHESTHCDGLHLQRSMS